MSKTIDTKPISMLVSLKKKGKTVLSMTVFKYEDVKKLTEIALNNRLEISSKIKIDLIPSENK